MALDKSVSTHSITPSGVDSNAAVVSQAPNVSSSGLALVDTSLCWRCDSAAAMT